MKYLTFSTPSNPHSRLGVLHGGRVVEVKRAVSMLDLIMGGPDSWARAAEAIRADAASGTHDSYALDAIRWHAPIPRPRKNVFCLGLNYMSHIQEQTAKGREPAALAAPVFFTKAPTTVNGPFDPIPWDRSVTSQVDYEAELGVIIGVDGKNIPREKARDYIFGYTVINDVSARDVQSKHKQWFKGKSLDGFCPMGPCIVTADEFGAPQQKRVSLKVNGVVKQDATTAEMLFPVDVIVEHLSHGMTIEAGDIIATGTPEGVGLARKPPEYLDDGDLVETEVEGIGVLRNRIAATGAATAPQS
jgi:2-keto-4-pentenoate hydratase/2-oxohepta-3-ene-1,7-dioic acid hydratase in catechol pathway